MFLRGERYRAQWLMAKPLRAGGDCAGSGGAKNVEGYPKEAEGRLPGGTEAYIGIASVFRKAGSVEVRRRAEHQPSMRYLVRGISSR